LNAVRHAVDERLLIQAAQRDPARFADLYERNLERVYAFIARRVQNRQEAEDLTSEVFHQALANLPRFEWRGAPFCAWLYRIASNAIADRWHRLSREGSPSSSDPAGEVADPENFDMEEIERRATLHRLVDGLPEAQRRVIVMRFAEQRSIREIAQELRRSEGAVKQLQLRGLQNLRERMGDANG
jgi:RNA polymerase sigma-70 factor, ECF subfamily